MKVLFLPSSHGGKAPVDRRRFLAFANVSPDIEVVYDSRENFDLVFCAGSGDIGLATMLKQRGFPLIFDYANHYLVENNWLKNRFRPFYYSIEKGHL